MPVAISAREMYGRTYSDDFQNSHAIRIFRVTMDSDTYFMSDVMDDITYVPALGSIYSIVHPELRCVSREIAEVARSLREFEVTCKYDRYPYNNWDIKISGQSVERILEQTLAPSDGSVGMPARFVGNPARYLRTKPLGAMYEVPCNRVYDPFDPPVMYQHQQIVITAEVLVDALADLNAALTTVGALEALVGKVNAERVQVCSLPDESGMGCDYWSLLLEDASVAKINTPTGCAYHISLRIVYDPLGHCAAVVNAGYNEFPDPATLEAPRRIRNSDQTDIASPAPLDADGKRIPPTSLPEAQTFIICPTHETFDFTLLGLPTTFCGSIPTLGP